jgi:sialic acid synthase SpsE
MNGATSGLVLVAALAPAGPAADAIVAAARAGANAVLVRPSTSGRTARLPFELTDFDLGCDVSAAAMTRDDLDAVMATARAQGVDVVLSVDDESALELARSVRPAAIHVPAGAVVDLALLAAAAPATQVWLDTAMTSADEVAEAVAEVVKAGGRPMLLHGLITTPPRPEELNLRAITTLASRFGVPVGFHLRETVPALAIAAAALGASVVVVPFTAGADMAAGADTAFGPQMLASLRADLHLVERGLGDGDKRVQPSEWAERDRAQRSLVARVDIARGRTITADLLTTARPGVGLKPRALETIIGRRATVDIPAGTLLTLGMIE